MADINRLMQIINALEAQGMDVESMLSSMIAPAPFPQVGTRDDGMPPPARMPQQMPRDDGMPPPARMPQQMPPGMTMDRLMEIRRRMQGMTPPPGLGSISRGEMDMIMDRMPRMQPGPGMGSISQGEMDMLRRRAMPRNNPGIFQFLMQ